MMDLETATKPPAVVTSGRFPGYRDVRTIGQGAQGKVKVATRISDGVKVALKFMDVERMSVAEITRMRQEYAHLRECSRHPHIVQLYGVQWDYRYRRKNGEIKRRVVFEMAYEEGGELFNVLSITGRLSEPIARVYFRQLVAGIQHCHLKGISHRDLKPENLLLDRFYNLKIADFGLSAKFAQAGEPIMHKSVVGTKLYVAPEVRTGHYFGPLADIWSAGVVLFIMLTGVPPFRQPMKGDWWFNRLMNGEFGAFWDAHRRNARLSREAEDLFQKIFQVDYRKRATMTVITSHPWIRGKTYSSDQLRAEFARRLRAVHHQHAQPRVQQQVVAHAPSAAADATFDTVFEADTLRTLKSPVGDTDGDKGDATTLDGDKGNTTPPALPTPSGAVSTPSAKKEETEASASSSLQGVERVLKTRSHFTCLVTRRVAKRSEVIARLQQACSRIRAKCKISSNPEPGTYALKCDVQTPAGRVKIRITVIAASHKLCDPETAHHSVVEIRRLMGDSLQFRGVFEVMCRDLNVVDLLVSHYALASSDTAFKML